MSDYVRRISIPMPSINSALCVQVEAEEIVEDLAHHTTYSNQMTALWWWFAVKLKKGQLKEVVEYRVVLWRQLILCHTPSNINDYYNVYFLAVNINKRLL